MAYRGEKCKQVRTVLIGLSEALLKHYEVRQPPVPVERMLEDPIVGMVEIDPGQISFVMEHGLYSYAPRLAMARLLFREIAESGIAGKAFEIELPGVTTADVKFFSRCLLMPAPWMHRLAQQALTVHQISVYLQVPSFAVVTRLAELGLSVPGAR